MWNEKLIPIYENIFSDNSYGFRPNRDYHLAINQALEYLNDGCEWVIDLDIEKYFDTVNHDKLISISRENVNDSHTLHLIRLFLRAGIMDNGLIALIVLYKCSAVYENRTYGAMGGTIVILLFLYPIFKFSIKSLL